jgi:chemotaxis protein CheY-P-specific phosphatase CheC
MKQQIDKVLQEVTIKTFEDACFVYAAPELKDKQKEFAWDAAAEVRFKGEPAGRLLLAVSGNLLAAMAGNMLSTENPTLQEKKDALGEVANIICGNVIPYLERTRKGGYKILSPRFLGRAELKKEKPEKPLAGIVLYLGPGRAEVKIFMERLSQQERKD